MSQFSHYILVLTPKSHLIILVTIMLVVRKMSDPTSGRMNNKKNKQHMEKNAFKMPLLILVVVLLLVLLTVVTT